MKIGLNGQYILIKSPAGPERFTINLYHYLALTDKINDYIIYVNDIPSKEFIEKLIAGNKKFKVKIIKDGFLWTQMRLAIELWIHPVDVFFNPIHTIPALKFPFTKYVTMIHGLEYKTNKELTKLSVKKLLHPFIIFWTTLFSDLIVVPSRATQDKVLQDYPYLKQSKFKIIHEGVSHEFFKHTLEEIEDVLNKHELEYKKYLLFVSTIQPRKNIPNMVHAFSNVVNSKQINDMKLVIVGKLGWNYTESTDSPKTYGVEHQVKFLNWVEQEDLPKLMSGAYGYVNFSLDEGFGLTVLEAMASEIPVAASMIPAHEEVADNTIVYADPNNVIEIENAISKLICDPNVNQNINPAKKRAENFSWVSTAKDTISAFERLKAHEKLAK